MKLNIKPEPDFNRLVKAVKRDGIPDRVPFYELFSDIQAETLEALGKPVVSCDDKVEEYLRNHIEYMLSLGYDYINAGVGEFRFPREDRAAAITRQGARAYQQSGTCTIRNMEDFEKYPWPDPAKIDYSPFEKAAELMPDGMKVMTLGPGGILENTMELLGFEGISYLLADEDPLVEDVFEQVAVRLTAYFDRVASFDCVGMITLGDDMGFKTQTLLSPAHYRKYVFHRHRKLVGTIHRRGKPVTLHSCGNLKQVMDDIIECGWDAKHSFEDIIQPVWEAKKEYGDRITLMGGFDVDKLTRMSEQEVRKHTRMLIEKCAPGGGWTLGSGNSIANYVPVNNLLAMLDEGYLAGKYRS